jgi:acyl CoA:acetate/3-ketoacid CoA transferase alpha subunit/acyl CoA:acetate/3-ketoacid CoA transferase beta subunit
MSVVTEVGVSLSDAVEQNIHPGDAVHIMLGHSRWTASAREMARQFWGTDPELTLIMTSLGALSALFFRGRMLRKVVTAYSGNSFPSYAPNPIFKAAYESGDVAVEHWSILTMAQRMEAAARGLPAIVTGSVVGSDLARNDAFSRVDSEFGPVGLLAPLAPDVALCHAAVSDVHGNLAISEPLLEGTWGAWAAKRGVVATVESIVPDLAELGHRVQIPAHRVLAVVEAPFGAHPGGCYTPGLPVAGYGEDIPFWIEAAAAARDDFDGWARTHLLEVPDHSGYLKLLGDDRLIGLRLLSDPDSWRHDAEANPLPVDDPISDWEVAAALCAREVEAVVSEHQADGVLAGAGVANLAAWVAVGRLRSAGASVCLTAELGLWDYTPTPADPYIFNHRVFPGTSFLSDASTVLGMLVGGPGTTVVGCVGAAEVDQYGNLNSTQLADGRFLVGSGGANDVVTRAAATVVATLGKPQRLPATAGYITAPGERVTSVVTDRGILRRIDGRLQVAAVPSGTGTIEERVNLMIGSCGWTPEVVREVEELSPVTMTEVRALREFDRRRQFLG